MPTSVSRPLVRIQDVNHHFGTGGSQNQVLFNINLEVLPGELVILAGISGCGKTTLLTLIGGLRTLQDGSRIDILNHGSDSYDTLAGMKEEQLVDLRKRIGFIFQRHNLFDSLTATQNVRMSQQLQPEKPTQRQALAAAVAALGLSPDRRVQPLPESVDPAKLQAVLALGGRVQPAALVVPATADVAFEHLLRQHRWDLDSRVLPLPCPADPDVLQRLGRHGVEINREEGTLTLPAGCAECVRLALGELGLRFGGRRLPLLGTDLDARLQPIKEAGGIVEQRQLILPAPAESQVDDVLTELGLQLDEYGLRLPGDVAEPVRRLLEQLGLRFNQGTLALPAEMDPAVLPLLPQLRFRQEGPLLWMDPAGSVFAVRVLQEKGMALDLHSPREGGSPASYAVTLPKNTTPEAVAGLIDLWPRLATQHRVRDMRQQRPARLSGGQRQRVAICRALINRPRLILADEPTAALDPERSAQVIQLLKARAILEGTTSLVVTHDVSIMRQADRIVTMVQGKIATNVVVAEEAFVFAALRRCALFAALTSEVQQKLTAELLIGVHPTADVPPGTAQRCPWFEEHDTETDIVKQGEWGDRAYLIRRGRVEVLRQPEEATIQPDGTEKLVLVGPPEHVAYLGPGDFFGDQAVLAGRPRNATVRALTAVETYSVTAKKFAVYRDESLPFINRILGVYGPGAPLVTPLVLPDGEGENAGGGTGGTG
jgi:ABC-type lipoprotein export system ATPase subunit/CRP-like cAMP-binding protein